MKMVEEREHTHRIDKAILGKHTGMLHKGRSKVETDLCQLKANIGAVETDICEYGRESESVDHFIQVPTMARATSEFF